MRLKEALDIKSGEVISLVGGGGKTTLMFALAWELASGGGCVITTTTTKIFEPLPSQTPLLLVEADEEKMTESLVQNMDKYSHITLARERLPSGKLAGISPELVDGLAGVDRVSCVIVEADGAKHRSLKAPGPAEPVVPSSTSLLIPVVGVDAVGCRLTEENVFRPRIVSELTGLPLGEVVSTEAIAFLITHHRGIIKGSPDGARIVPFINKVDLDKGLSRGRDLAGKILAMKHPQIERVVLGQAQLPEPVIEVIQGGSRD
jgi:probable selenium-dependent hydroxylase accessory protein YqeC